MKSEELIIKIGNNIRKFRKEKNLSIESLALICSINTNYLGDLERGRRNPTISILNKVCLGLNINLKQLFD